MNSGYVNSISLLNDGSGYTGTPTVSISTQVEHLVVQTHLRLP